MFCPYCGAKAEDDFSFCAKCGKRLPSVEKDGADEKRIEKPTSAEPASPKDDNYLDKQFRRIIAKMPGEALSHFKVGDSATWRVAMAETAEAKRFATLGWCGPYTIKVLGKKYVAYANRDRLPASQVKFLHEWSRGYKRALKIKLRALNDDSSETARRLIALVVAGAIIAGCGLVTYLLSVKWGGSM